MFLVIADANRHSKWIEGYNSGQASNGLMRYEILRQAFVQHGLLDAVASGNGAMFYQQCVFSVYETEWLQTYQSCTISPRFQWSGTKCRPEIQGWSKENDYGYFGRAD